MAKDVIGTAYVRVVALSSDFEKQVQRAFDRLKPMAQSSGEQVSQSWMQGFEGHFNQAMADAFERLQNDVGDSWGEAGQEHGEGYGDSFGHGAGGAILDDQSATIDAMEANWADAGARHGTAYGDPFSVEVDRAMGRSVDNATNLWQNSNLMRYPLEAIQDVARQLPDILGDGVDAGGPSLRQRIANVFQGGADDTRNIFQRLGAGISATLADAFSGAGGGGRIFKALTDGADEASHAFTILFGIGQLLGSAIVALVAGIANVASGLFALVSAASQAAASLAVIPGLIGAIIQAGATLAIGFSGAGKAISAGMKEATAATTGATTASNRLQSAQRAVETAARSLENAEKSAARAKKELADAQKNLNESYKEGAKQLRDIQYAAEDAALQEERAALNLADARDALLKAKAENPPDSRAVQEAELAYKEADLAYREARSRNKDTQEEAADAMKKGVKGTQAVTSAQERLIRAQEAVAESNQRVADAQRALADAQKNANTAIAGGAAAVSQYQQALKKFGPNGQQFIKTVVGMRTKFTELKKAAGEGFFDDLTDSLNTFANGPAFTILKRRLGDTSAVLGGVIARFSDMLFSGKNLASLDRIFGSNLIVIQNFGRGATALGQSLISIVDAARPLTQEFSGWAAKLTEGWAATLKADNASGKLTEKFKAAAVVAKQLGRIFKNVFDAIRDTMGAAQSGGATMLDDLEAATKKWSDWTSSVKGENQLKKYFEDVAPGFKSIMEGFNSIVKELAKLGGDRNLTEGLGAGLQEISTWIAPVGSAVSRVMPDLVEMLKSVGSIFKALQASPALDYFAKTLRVVAGVLERLINNPVGIFFITTLGAIMGVVRALRLLQIGFKFISAATIGKGLKTLSAGFGGLKKLLGGKSIFDDTTKGSEAARDEFRKQIKVDKLKKQAMEGVGDGAKIAAQEIDKSTDASKKNRKSFGTRAKEAVFGPTGKREAKKPSKLGKLGKLGKGVGLAGLGLAGAAVAGVVGLAMMGKDQVDALAKQISGAVKNLPGVVQALAANIPQVISSLAGSIGPIISSIADALPDVIDALIKALPVVLAALADALPKVITTIVKLLPVVIKALAKLLPQVVITLAKLLPQVITSLAKALPEVITALIKAVPEIITALVEAIPEVIGAIIAAIPEIIKALIDAIPEIISALIDAVPEVISAIVGAIPAIVGAVIDQFPDVFKDMFDTAYENLTTIWSNLTGFFTTLWDGVTGYFKTVWNFYTTVFKTAWDTLVRIWGGVSGWFQERWNTLKTNVSKVIGWLSQPFKDAWTKITEVWSGVSGWFQEKISAIITKFSRLPNRISTMVSGMWDGIKTAFKSALNWVIDKWNSLQFNFPSFSGDWNGILPGGEFTVGGWEMKTPHINRLASGGIAMARPGGVLANIAEAGRSELVKPLDGKGFTASDRAIMQMIQRQGEVLGQLVGLLGGSTTGGGISAVLSSTSSTAAVVAAQRVASTGSMTPSDKALVGAINKLTASVDDLQRPLVGGSINVMSAPNEWAADSVPRALRRRAYTRGRGAR